MSERGGTDGHPIVDELTIARARRGHRDALTYLWRCYQPQLLRYLAARRCPQPDDSASEVWIRVGRSLERFQGDGVAFRRWLFTIARHVSIDEIRRVGRHAVPTDPDDLVDASGPGDGDPADDVGGLDRAIALVRRLPTDMADAVMLRHVYDMAVPDVAAIMDTSEGNVRVLTHRGLGRLRSFLSPESPDESGARPSTSIPADAEAGGPLAPPGGHLAVVGTRSGTTDEKTSPNP